MVRGTYLPLPSVMSDPSLHFVVGLEVRSHTSLGEESRETVVDVSGLALFGEESIRL